MNNSTLFLLFLALPVLLRAGVLLMGAIFPERVNTRRRSQHLADQLNQSRGPQKTFYAPHTPDRHNDLGNELNRTIANIP